MREKKLEWSTRLPAADEMKKIWWHVETFWHTHYTSLTDWRTQLPSDRRLQWRCPVNSSSIFPPLHVTPDRRHSWSWRNSVPDSTCRNVSSASEWWTNVTIKPSMSRRRWQWTCLRVDWAGTGKICVELYENYGQKWQKSQQTFFKEKIAKFTANSRHHSRSRNTPKHGSGKRFWIRK